MPYIVTTHRHLDDPTAEFLPGAKPGVSRRAVATLDEAWNTLPPGIPDYTLVRERFALEEHGQCRFTLPDGTVIEVEYADRQLLLVALGDPPAHHATTDQIIVAYNAAQ